MYFKKKIGKLTLITLMIASTAFPSLASEDLQITEIAGPAADACAVFAEAVEAEGTEQPCIPETEEQPDGRLFSAINGKHQITFVTNCDIAITPKYVDDRKTIEMPEGLFRHSYVFAYWYTKDPDVPFDFSAPITEDLKLYAKWDYVGWRIEQNTSEYVYLKANGEFLKNDWKAKSGKLVYLDDAGHIAKNTTVSYKGNEYRVNEDGALIIQSETDKFLFADKFPEGEDSPEKVKNIHFTNLNREPYFCLDAPLLCTYAINPSLHTDYYGDNGWVIYPAERLTTDRYRKFGDLYFFFDAKTHRKVTSETRTIGGREYTFDENGVCLDWYLTMYGENEGQERKTVKLDCGTTYRLKDLSPGFTKQHCVFRGWSSTVDGKNIIPDDMPFYSACDTSVYAVWDSIRVNVTFDGNGHGRSRTQTVNAGSLLTDPGALSEEGFTFHGWYKEPGCVNPWNFSTDRIGDTDVTVYAYWTRVIPDAEKNRGTRTVISTNTKTSPAGGHISSSPGFFTGAPGNPVKGQWVADQSNNWQFFINDVKLKSTWAYIAYNNGLVGWFWFNRNGIMLTGWQEINKKWYYLNPIPGPLYGLCQLGGVTPDGYVLNPDGSWTGR